MVLQSGGCPAHPPELQGEGKAIRIRIRIRINEHSTGGVPEPRVSSHFQGYLTNRAGWWCSPSSLGEHFQLGMSSGGAQGLPLSPQRAQGGFDQHRGAAAGGFGVCGSVPPRAEQELSPVLGTEQPWTLCCSLPRTQLLPAPP